LRWRQSLKTKRRLQKDIIKTTNDVLRLNADVLKYEAEIEKRTDAYTEGQGRIAESYINLLAGVKNQRESKEAQLLNLEQKLITLDQSIQAKGYEKVYETKPTEVEVPAIPPETRIAPNRKTKCNNCWYFRNICWNSLRFRS